MGAEFRVSNGAQQIIDALKDVLGGAIHLFDEEKRIRHCAMSKRWLSIEGPMPETPAGLCHAEARINDRWILHVMRRPALHPDVASIAKWAAGKLAAHLPRHTASEPTYPPFGGGGGPSGSAEIGIPVWWARRTRG